MSKYNNDIEANLGMHGHVIVERADTGEILYETPNALTTAFLSMIAQSIATPDVAESPLYVGVGTGGAVEYDPDITANQVIDDGDHQRLSMPFQLSNGRRIHTVIVKARRPGISNGNVWVEIQNNSGGNPSGTPVANGVSPEVPINSIIENSDEWLVFTYDGSPDYPNLSSDTTYHLVLKADGNYNYDAGVEEISWALDDTDLSYAQGNMQAHDGSDWFERSPTAQGAFRLISRVSSSNSNVLGQMQRNLMTARATTGASSARLLANFRPVEAQGYIGHVGLFPHETGTPLHAIANVNFNKGEFQVNVYWLINVMEST